MPAASSRRGATATPPLSGPSPSSGARSPRTDARRPWRRPSRSRRCPSRASAAVLSVLFGVLVLAAQPSLAASPATDLASVAGYLDPEQLDLYSREENVKVEVNLQGPLIQFVAEAARGTEPDLADAFSRLRSVVFRLYRVGREEAAGVRRSTADAASVLERRGWQRVVKVRDEGIETYVFLKTEGNRIVGLTALFFDDEEQFGFINVAGEIDPAQIGRIGRRLDIDVLEETQEELEKGGGPREGDADTGREGTGRPPAEAPPPRPPEPW